MKVKKFFFNDNECYFITTDSGVPVTDACRYLKSLWLNNVSNSTIASKAYDLALYFEYLDEFKINHLKVNNNNIIDFISYINLKQLKSIKRIKNITTIIYDFYEFIFQYKEDNVPIDKINFQYKKDNVPIDKIKKINININNFSTSNKKEFNIINDIEPICELTTNPRDELLVRILFETGARGSEVINLTRNSLIYSSHCLKGLNYNCTFKCGCSECSHYYFGYSLEIESYKTKSNRIVPISEKLASLFIDYNEKILMYIKRENNFIFVKLNGTNIGKQLRSSYVSTVLKSISKKSLCDINSHILRRSFILNALKKYDLQSVSYITGTSTLSLYNYLRI